MRIDNVEMRAMASAPPGDALGIAAFVGTDLNDMAGAASLDDGPKLDARNRFIVEERP